MRANSEMGRKLRRRAARYFLGMDIVRSRTERPNNVDLDPEFEATSSLEDGENPPTPTTHRPRHAH